MCQNQIIYRLFLLSLKWPEVSFELRNTVLVKNLFSLYIWSHNQSQLVSNLSKACWKSWEFRNDQFSDPVGHEGQFVTLTYDSIHSSGSLWAFMRSKRLISSRLLRQVAFKRESQSNVILGVRLLSIKFLNYGIGCSGLLSWLELCVGLVSWQDASAFPWALCLIAFIPFSLKYTQPIPVLVSPLLSPHTGCHWVCTNWSAPAHLQGLKHANWACCKGISGCGYTHCKAWWFPVGPDCFS